ncbi:Nrap protein [Massariosphaeria phaeospora]|uniref:U3 small nucleolar RNA-associated protein 22 n=1 Tax=Massariosphaeria phaeospora TaxID=100035 RepID=A0A7C8I2H1_9PLEO|nr:Nrap protein [Massariosphaeria phaeospora]
MTPPVTKRRKLSHSDQSDDSEASFAGFDSSGAEETDQVVAEPSHEHPSTTSEDNGTAEKGLRKKQGDIRANGSGDNDRNKQHKRPDVRPQDGVCTAEAYKSNMFKLQVDELLDQVKPKYGRREAPAEHAMRTLKNIIEQLPGREPLPVPEAVKVLKSVGVVIPFPDPRPPKDAKYKLQYERPSSINATGSYPLKTATRGEDGLTIDLVVTMPNTTLQDKDYLNHRYFYKRAYYLACLAAGIKASKEHKFELSYAHLNGNQLQPILVVQSPRDGSADDFSSSKCRINILLALPEKTFPDTKLLPTANCVRLKLGEDDSDAQPLAPTPFYNSTLQSDATVTAYLKLLHSTSSRCDAFKNGCVLGRVWLGQRGFGSAMRKGGFGNFEWAALMAILLQPNPGTGAPPLSSGYSSYQLFKATLQFLARHELTKKPYIFGGDKVTFPKQDATPVFFDGARCMNLLFKMTPWSYLHLKDEAQLTVDILSESMADAFDSSFIVKADLLRYRHDAFLEIPLSTLELEPASEEYDQRLVATCQNLYGSLTRALTDRVKLLSFSLPNESSWSISSNRTAEDQQKCVLIKFATDPANANRSVDRGPAAEEKKEAASFRQFWGQKAELRRFKDGSILESVVWSPKESSFTILEQIIFYIIGKHVGTQVAEKARFTGDTFAHLVTFGHLQGQSGVSAFLPRMNALGSLEQDIRGLEGLPLQVRHIRPADQQLRYSAIEAPTSLSTSAPASVVLQFEGSARWPDDLCAIQRTKIAFLLKLSDVLSTAHPTYVAKVGLENVSQPSQNQAFLDIILATGFCFRLRIHHDREATLLERQLKDKSLDVQSRESAASSLALYKRDFLQIPAHTQALQTLCTRFLALSPAIRLTKKWFASHLLMPHFSHELIELMVVRTFLQPHPWPVPSCATTGFLRSLAWLSRWDWRHVPLVVDFSSPASITTEYEPVNSRGLRAEDIEKIQTRFEAWRKIDPAMNRVVLFAATNLDVEGNTWTDKGKPEKVVAARMTALARSATKAIRLEDDRLVGIVNGVAGSTSNDSFSPKSLFVPEPRDYDIVINIALKYTETGRRKSEPKYKNVQIQQAAGQTKGSNIVQLFAEDLQSVYGDAVLWFWDPESLNRIAGIWNPAVTGQRTWKVKVGWNSLPLYKEGAAKEKPETGERGVDIQLNKVAICNEIKRLGGELINTLEVKA